MKKRIKIQHIPLKPDEAFTRWKANITSILDDLREALEAPLPTDRIEHIEVRPGEPGYDDAPYEVAVDRYPLVFKTKL